MADFGTVSTLPPGFMLGDRYEIQRVIGQGGMGIVYLAKDTLQEGELRAIKTIKPDLMADPDGARQLGREATSAQRLGHPNIVRVFHYDQWQGISFIVMEYVEGKTLAEIKAKKGSLSEGEVISITEQVCDALSHAHSQSIIHQDLKPANIFMTNDGRVKLVDFGIARIMKDTATRLTGQMPSGTLIYMSPELLRGKKPSIASDIYSMGVVLYELLTGEAPFVRGDITWQHLNEQPEAIKGISAVMHDTVMAALAKDPDHRPASAEVLKSLLPGGTPVTQPVAPPVTPAAPPKPKRKPKAQPVKQWQELEMPRSAARAETGEAPIQRPMRFTFTISLVAIVLIAGIGFAILEGRNINVPDDFILTNIFMFQIPVLALEGGGGPAAEEIVGILEIVIIVCLAIAAMIVQARQKGMPSVNAFKFSIAYIIMVGLIGLAAMMEEPNILEDTGTFFAALIWAYLQCIVVAYIASRILFMISGQKKQLIAERQQNLAQNN